MSIRGLGTKVNEDVSDDEFDKKIASAAASAGLNIEEPFPFVVEGDFVDVRLHVINGACPIRARMKKTELPADQQPFEAEMSEVTGKLVGVYRQGCCRRHHPSSDVHPHASAVQGSVRPDK